MAVAAVFFTAFFAACFFTCFLAGLVAGPAAWKAVAPAVFCAVNAAGVAANVRPEQKRPAVRHRAVMLDFMGVLWGTVVEWVAVALVCGQLQCDCTD